MSQISKDTIGGISPTTLVSTVTTQDGIATASANNLNFNGYPQTPAAPQIGLTHATGSTFTYEDLTWTTAYVVDPSTTVGTRGTYSTIQSAITAAPAGQATIARQGTYTESNVIFKQGTQLLGLVPSGGTGESTKLVGNLTDNGTTANCTVNNFSLQANGANFLNCTGSTGDVNLYNCDLRCVNTTGINAAAGKTLFLKNCDGDLSTTGIAYFTGGAGINIYDSNFDNSGSSTTVSSITGSLIIRNSSFSSPIGVSSSGILNADNLYIDTSLVNASAIQITGSSTSILQDTFVASGTAAGITVGSGARINAINCTINSSNAAAVSGAGTFAHDGFVYTGSAKAVTATEVLLPHATMWFGQGQVVNYTAPGAYPYTVLTTDYVIGVDTSAARTINLPASPRTGQTFRIKDVVGTAGANNVTIVPAAGNIDGAANLLINSNYGSVDLCYNGTEWSVL